MKTNDIYKFTRKQIPVLMVLSLFPGLGYIFLGWLNDIYFRAACWYLAIIVLSIWGYRLYRSFDLRSMSELQLTTWYKKTSVFMYVFFSLWAVIFILYANESASGMNYIAIFTEIGASTVAAAVLFPDKKLYKPNVIILIIPLTIYFSLLGTWYGYVLTIFSMIFGWVLIYAATNSNNLFTKTIFQSTHDYLTGLFNRQYFIEYLQTKMNSLKQSNEYSYLLLIDLDHFKTINDSLGHDIGDVLLQNVVQRIKDVIPENTMVARLGGDEFVITGNNFPSRESCKDTAIALSSSLLS
ncbi:MAG: diguanylate cyclase, partial [Gammaproteobacteria bacterium]|nr:diguanylate cyclase [Gammaproteobacteria bacterium]